MISVPSISVSVNRASNLRPDSSKKREELEQAYINMKEIELSGQAS